MVADYWFISSNHFRANLVNLDLYYESMSEIIVQQNKAMDDTALLGKLVICYPTIQVLLPVHSRVVFQRHLFIF